MPPPDVALIAPYPAGGQRHAGRSGVASYTANLAHALARAGVRPLVVAPREDGEPAAEDDGPVPVVRPFRRGRGGLAAAVDIADRCGAPVVHLQLELFLYGGPVALPGVVAAVARLRRRGLGPVVTLHQVVDPVEVDRDYTALHRVAVPSPLARVGIAGVQRAVAALSTATVVHEQRFRRVIPDAVTIPHGVEVTRAATDCTRGDARRRLGLDGFVVLCFGFLAPYKGLELALEAAAVAGTDVHLVVAGGEHPRLAGRDRYAEELGRRYRAAARFVGWVPDGDVSAWFRAADVALLPYPKPFSSSGALALALAHRTPVLLSPPLAQCIGAPADMVAPNEPVALAARLRALAADADARARLAGWSASFAEGRSWDAVGRRHAQLYEEMCSP